ncbi:Titin [Bienertia sinuspersici]
MNASKFMDKQIMDLSRSKSSDFNNNNSDFMDLMNPQSEEEADHVQSDPPSSTRALNSTDTKPNSATLRVQTGVQDLKDKQEVMEGHMQLAKLQISKAEKSELPTPVHHDSVQQIAASAPQQPGVQQFSIPAPQQVPSLPPNAPPPSQQNVYPAPGTTQFPPGPTPPVPQRDAYFTQSNQTQEVQSQQYQMPPPAQHHQQPLNPAPEAQSQQYQMPPPAQHQQQPLTPAPPQQYQSTPVPPYPHTPQPQQQHPAIGGANPPHIPPPMGHRAEEGPYVSPSHSYPPNLHQPASQPNNTPPHSQPYYGSPPAMYDPPSTGRSSSGFPSAYGPPSGPGEPYTYGGPASQYSSGSSVKVQPHSPVGSNSNYPHLPTARILPPSIPSATGISGGSSSGGSGNKVPIDDVVEKVTNMGFPKDVVRATVRKLTENGQSVDLNVVLDKLMNDGDVQPQRGWFGR